MVTCDLSTIPHPETETCENVRLTDPDPRREYGLAPRESVSYGR
jgi:hypothetical protein